MMQSKTPLDEVSRAQVGRGRKMMIEGRVRIAKLGRGAEAVAALKEMVQLCEDKVSPITYRIYRLRAGPAGAIAFEWEHESLAEYDRVVTALLALPEFRPLDQRWMAEIEPGGTNEIWELVE